MANSPDFPLQEPSSAAIAERQSKVPPLTTGFWIMKICATTLGETAGDLLSMTLALGYAASSAVLLSLFLITLGAQFWSKTYQPLRYWAVILTTSTAGTTLSDFLDRTVGLGYAAGSALLLSLLIVILSIWWYSCRSISVTQIRTRKAELFYWLAVLVSNTLGTALGDYLADDSGLGFMGGAAVIGSLLLAAVAAWRFTTISRIALFWFAFVLTRPFGATFGDVLTKPADHGGVGFGTLGSSIALLLVLLISLAVTNSGRNVRSFS